MATKADDNIDIEFDDAPPTAANDVGFEEPTRAVTINARGEEAASATSNDGFEEPTRALGVDQLPGLDINLDNPEDIPDDDSPPTVLEYVGDDAPTIVPGASLEGLKRASPSSLGSPPSGSPPSMTSGSPPSLPSPSATSGSMPASPPPVRQSSLSTSKVHRPVAASSGGPPEMMEEGTLKKAAVLAVVVAVVVVVATRSPSVTNLKPIRLSIDAVACVRTSCHAPPKVLLPLPPAERDVRLRYTVDEARKGGLRSITFQDGERIWRTTEVPPATPATPTR